MIKIDKDIPIPTKYRERKYPFPDMQIGDSFFIALDDDFKTKKLITSSIHSSLRKLKKSSKDFKDYKMLLRSVEGGMRGWRVQ